MLKATSLRQSFRVRVVRGLPFSLKQTMQAPHRGDTGALPCGALRPRLAEQYHAAQGKVQAFISRLRGAWFGGVRQRFGSQFDGL